MKKISESISIKPYMPKLLRMYFKNKRAAVFDIETTGLNPESSRVILSGILKIDGDRGEIVQYFSDSRNDEDEILDATGREISSVDYLLTYNGRHFDLPFIKKRAVRCGFGVSDFPYTLDLYQVLNGYSSLKSFLPDLKQKTVEFFMGLSDGRDDEISGRESIDLYFRYLEEKSPAFERAILLHNHDDLVQLYRLLPVIELTDFHKAMFFLGFPLDSFRITKMYTKGSDFFVFAKQTKAPLDYISFPTEERPYYLSMSKRSRSVRLVVPCFKERGSVICDAESVLGHKDERLTKYPNVVNGYLIVGDEKGLNHMELNAFVMAFFSDVLPHAAP